MLAARLNCVGGMFDTLDTARAPGSVLLLDHSESLMDRLHALLVCLLPTSLAVLSPGVHRLGFGEHFSLRSRRRTEKNRVETQDQVRI